MQSSSTRALAAYPNGQRDRIAARVMRPSLFHGVYKVAADMQIAIRHSRNARHVAVHRTRTSACIMCRDAIRNDNILNSKLTLN